MNLLFRCWSRRSGVAMCLALLGGTATAQDGPDQRTGPPTTDALRVELGPADQLAPGSSLALSSLSFRSQEPISEQTTVTVTESDTSRCPATFDITYSLSSDYIFRGINRSEPRGEGREKPNHQLTTDLGVDIGQLVGEPAGTCGTLSFSTFFEWYGAQKTLNPFGGGQNLQEVDYTVAWSYDLEPCDATVTLGYTFYTFPNVHAVNTSEWFFDVDHNDAWMWKWLWADNEEGVLNPSFAFYQDVDRGGGNAIWMELGFSHEFDVHPGVTVTPSWTLGMDHDYYHHFAGDPHKNTFRFANMLWGLDIAYDMTELLRLPEGAGSVALSGFVYFSDALGNAEDNRIIQDEFYGGMSIGWSF